MKEKSIKLRTVCLLSIVVLMLSLVLMVPMQKAKASVVDLLQEYWVTNNGCAGMNHAGTTWHAQTFTANSTYNLTAIELQFIRHSGATGSLTVSIRLAGCILIMNPRLIYCLEYTEKERYLPQKKNHR